MRFSELLKEEITTLNNIYGGDMPDDHEMIWNFVNNDDFDTPLEIEVMPKYKLLITLLSQYRVEHIDEITDLLDSDQKEIVGMYENDPNLSTSVIVIADGKIVDGNHRALAAALTNRSIRYVELT
jgi:hypothetical protein